MTGCTLVQKGQTVFGNKGLSINKKEKIMEVNPYA
jgi:hypothetical protein